MIQEKKRGLDRSFTDGRNSNDRESDELDRGFRFRYMLVEMTHGLSGEWGKTSPADESEVAWPTAAKTNSHILWGEAISNDGSLLEQSIVAQYDPIRPAVVEKFGRCCNAAGAKPLKIAPAALDHTVTHPMDEGLAPIFYSSLALFDTRRRQPSIAG
jgi:hypothetical protein